MKLTDIILAEEVTPAEVGILTGEIVKLLQDGKEVMMPTGHIITLQGVLNVAVRNMLDSYVQKMGSKLASVKGIEAGLGGKSTVVFNYSEEGEKAAKDQEAGMKQYIDQERQAGRSID